MKVTIGGNRVGSGQKMKADVHNYFRSTHNLSEIFTSSMQCGLLYPSLVKPVMRGDTFDIFINQDCRTIPTKGPLFGSFKMQTDIYFVPLRLYQGILHNNPLAIGLKMSQVKLPMLDIRTRVQGATDTYSARFNNTCLLKYLGMSGLGRSEQQIGSSGIRRRIMAIPTLAYYDIFKNYYANKQEEKAYVIGTINVENSTQEITSINIIHNDGHEDNTNYKDKTITSDDISDYAMITIGGENISLNTTEVSINFHNKTADIDTQDTYNINDWLTESNVLVPVRVEDNILILIVNKNFEFQTESCTLTDIRFNNVMDTATTSNKMLAFDLTNIDEMRYKLLSNNRLGEVFQIKDINETDTNTWSNTDGTDGTGLPYSQLVKKDVNNKTNNIYTLNGLLVKTYQNDIFNNWLNSDWIEGENGINELTKVEVENGAFTMDALNLAQKLYNMLNRVAVAGNTYEDWQDVVWEQVKRKQIESPIFCGGCSHEVVFDEIIQTAPAEGDPLGTLGGRGRVAEESQKGGKVHIKVDEAGFIIAITSLTPRIFQTQGNEFFNTEMESLDDFHKPALDGIGFQDLIGERMAWWDTVLTANDFGIRHRTKVGKLPAWIEYMTSVDKAYGDFAEEYGKGYMILNRNYERTEEGEVKDFTTYIDPTKYNYAFAYKQLDAQNFWVKIKFGIKARRLMSARLIPNV